MKRASAAGENIIGGNGGGKAGGNEMASGMASKISKKAEIMAAAARQWRLSIEAIAGENNRIKNMAKGNENHEKPWRKAGGIMLAEKRNGWRKLASVWQ
jgi:hypothetical protein